MPTIRFDVSKKLNDKLNKIKGGMLKIPYSAELFEKAIEAEYKRLNKKGGYNG